MSTISFIPTVATESPPLHATITMASHQNNPPPSGGSYASFASAQEQPETPGALGTDGVSPSLPRILFDRSALPRLPSYLTHYINSTSATLNFQEVQEEEEECGRRDDDSVESAAEARDLTEALVQTFREREEDPDDAVAFTNENGLREVAGANLPTAPEDWSPPAVKADCGEPVFETVDNPGSWNQFCFRPSFCKQKKYVSHKLPTGVMPCPEADGVRKSNGWVFVYKNWKLEDSWKSDGPFAELIANVEDVPSYRSCATTTNLLPPSRKGHLDYAVLKRLGLSRSRLLRHDPLFFYQLLLPVCKIEKSGIKDDPRQSYYSKVMTWSHKYALELGLTGSYGHKFREIMIPELLRFDGVLIRDGVLNGSTDGALYRRWDSTSSGFDNAIYNSITHTRFLQLKRTLKLCDNSSAPKRGEPLYNPAYKYDYIYETIVHNMRELTAKGSLDLCGDESSWAHQGFGEPGAGIVSRIFNKPGITKGGQVVLLVDAYRARPYAYAHRHKCHGGYQGWNMQGPVEVRLLMESINPFTKGGDAKCLWGEDKPHSTWDNHFSGCQVLDWLGENGFSATMTCRRDRLPRGVPKNFFHFEGTKPGDKKAKVARFLHPITAVKIVKRQGVDEEQAKTSSGYYTRVHVSMQSTSSTNFSSVNSFNAVTNYVQVKERGSTAKGTKQTWGIEMNEARELYLSTYGSVDTVDSQIRRCSMNYRTFKYWHAPKNHALALAVVAAYGMYEECLLEEKAHNFWDLDDEEKKRAKKEVLSFYQFREKLSLQALSYTPVNRYYPGDKLFREVTQMSNERRQEKKRQMDASRIPSSKGETDTVTFEQFQAIEKKQKKTNSRFCGDLSKLKLHIESKRKATYKMICAVCGEGTWAKCSLCGVGLHDSNSKAGHANKTCFTDYHDNTMFGLCRIDTPTMGKDKTKWTPPTVRERERNREAMLRHSTGAMSTRSARSTTRTTTTERQQSSTTGKK